MASTPYIALPQTPGNPPPQAGYPPPVATQPGFTSTHTTVVVNQPAPLILQQGQRDWSSALCACCEDCYSYESMEILANLTRADLVELLSVATKGELFQFNGALYQQTHADAMGSPLGPLLPNVFISSIEENLEREGCMGTFCSWCLLCQVSERMGEGCMFATCCQGALLGLRVKLRTQQNIQGTLCNDYCEVLCCPSCVLCQLSRELDRCGTN